MALFPSNKKDFKAFVNTLRTNSNAPMELKTLTEQEEEDLRDEREALQEKQITALQKMIENLKFPDSEINERKHSLHWTSRKGCATW